MVDNGNGTYTIKNTQTGESKIVGVTDLAKYGLSVPSDRYTVNPQTGYSPSDMSNPTIIKNGGLLGNILNSVNPTGDNSVWAKLAPSVLSGGPDAVINNIPAAAGAAGNIAEGIGNKLGFLSSVINPSKAGQAVGDATLAGDATGVTKSAADILTEAKQAIEDKFAPQGLASADPALQRSFTKMVNHTTGVNLTPQTVMKLPDFSTIGGELNPSDLVKLRQSIVSRFGYNPENGNIDQKVANVFRDVLSKNAKEIAPGLSQADSTYVKSQQFKDMLPTIAKIIGYPAAAGAGYNLFNILKGGGQNNNQSQ
jgi:hypothetical protein